MKMFVIGASGFLGRNILGRHDSNKVEIKGSHYEKPSKNTVRLDITDKKSIQQQILEFSPEVIIHCGSLRIDLCEKDPKLSYLINVQGTKNLVEVCHENNIHLIYISSDAVFDGKSVVNDENTKPNPLGVFGKNKVESESIIREKLNSYCIIRTSLLFGWDFRQSNFAQWIIKELSKNHQIEVISDQIVTPAYCKNMADIILEVAARKIRGLYHASGKEQITRANFAYNIAQIFNLDQKLLIPTTMEKLKLNMKRGKNCALDISKLLSVLNTQIMSLDTALSDMLKTRFELNLNR